MRTIAEILSYNRRYTSSLNPKIFDEDNHMYKDVHDSILVIIDTFLEYSEIDVKVLDIRVVGSNASYNYSDTSDLDVHIVVDLSKVADPETIAKLYFDSVKKNFKDTYDITIKGIEVEIYVEDVNSSAVTNGIYSVIQDEWIKEPVRLEDPTEEDLSSAETIEDAVLDKISNSSTKEEYEDIIDDLYLMRKDALSKDGESGVGNLVFKSLRNKGVLDMLKDRVHNMTSKELSLENKCIRR